MGSCIAILIYSIEINPLCKFLQKLYVVTSTRLNESEENSYLLGNKYYYKYFELNLQQIFFSYCRDISIPLSSLICMSAHKASAARCHLEHQAWSGQPAIQALPQSPLRRLTQSVLITSPSTSYQTTGRVSERSSIKGTRQCKPTRSSSFAIRHVPGCNVKEGISWTVSLVQIQSQLAQLLRFL